MIARHDRPQVKKPIVRGGEHENGSLNPGTNCPARLPQQGILRNVPENSTQERARTRRMKFYVWWYLCIAAAFVLLAIRSYMWGDGGWSIAARLVIATGFFALARLTQRTAKAQQKGPRIG